MAQAKKALAKKARKSAGRAANRSRTKTYQNYIGGRWVPSASGEWLENINPADTRDVVGRFPRSNEEDVDRAVAAAADAFDHRRRPPAPRRAEIRFRLGENLIRNKRAYTADLHREL